MSRPVTPEIAADVIIEMPLHDDKPIVLIERKYKPYGWAIPGGFVDIGETVADAARREALEETSLEVNLVTLLGLYSNPKRDIRGHTVTAVFVGTAVGKPLAADDAKEIALFDPFDIKAKLAFDHQRVISDYCDFRRDGVIKLPE